MRSDYLVVDVDAHFGEPVDDLAEYMEEPLRSVVKGRSEFHVPGSLGDRSVAGRIVRRPSPYMESVDQGELDTGPHRYRGYTPGLPGDAPVDAATLTNMREQLGVDASILVPSKMFLLSLTSPRDVVVAYYNAVIDFALDHCVDPANGWYTMALVPWQDPEAGAELIHRVAGHPGLVAICFPSANAVPPLGDEHYDAMYKAAQDHGLPVVFHSAPGPLLHSGAGYAPGFQRLIEAHSLDFLTSNIIQITSVLLRGLPERFPDLKFLFQESGLFWVPAVAYRLDEYFLKRRSEAPLLKALPSDYIRDRFYFGTQPIESPKKLEHLEAVFDMIGTDHVLYASDYPHFDYDDPAAILKLSFLSSDEKRRVLSGNAIELFGLARATQAWLMPQGMPMARSTKP